LNNRVKCLEEKLCILTAQNKNQFERNYVAFEEFQKFKSDFEKASSMLRNVEKINESSNNVFKEEVDTKQCKIKVNIRQKSPTPKHNSSASESDDDDEVMTQEKYDVMSEITRLKSRMESLSESLKLQAKCVKKLKCDDLERMKNNFDVIQESLNNIKCEVIEQRELITSSKTPSDDVDQIEQVKNIICKINCHLQEIDVKMDKAKEENCERLHSLKMDLVSRINQQIWSRTTTTNHSSHIMNTQNLEKSETACETRTTPEFCRDVENVNYPTGNGDQESLFLNRCQISSLNSCCPVPSVCEKFQCQTSSTASMQVHPECPESPNIQNNFYCLQPENCESYPCMVNSINNIYSKVSSHNFCPQQLIHDISKKLDRSEFEFYRRQLSETIDLVLKLKQQLKCPTAAGGVVPISCISCQTSTNMSIATNTIPFVNPLKFGRTGNLCDSFNLRPQCHHVANRNWRCVSRRGARRVCGSHTKIGKAIEVHEMRYKRLKTPIKVISSTLLYKTRFRRC
jgi:hypothetical protein